ncbi:Crp/Fnr family transcriptional regulator [Micrococcus sp.]|uniref:Crp/Fnr family transcriptional regulator n=1 Tax=Micrococcus sp. TaxID=1271 RepID=UPI002A9124DD|nr:Crp/Fnr family transcriptional regulator [Micrococcus sp.]MDY6054383.1 Crp/Fnr family transcriptional regulator [Micrococcus sp.]
MRVELSLTPVGEPEPCAARVPLFAGLDLAQLRRVSALARPVSLDAGEAWLLPGERTERFCVVHRGTLALTRGSATGQERVVRMVEASDSVGEHEFLTGEPSHYGARALTPTRLCTFSHEEVAHFLAEYPGIGARVMRTLAVRLAEAERRLAQERLPVTARIAEYLVGLPAVRDGDGVVVSLTVPKKDVASLLGTTPEAFSRGLRRLADEGLVRVAGPRVTLVDPEALEALSAR